MLSHSAHGTRQPIALDLAEKTLTTPTSLVLGGWLCTPGGVDCYKIRVTKVNGEAVAEYADEALKTTPGRIMMMINEGAETKALYKNFSLSNI